METVKYSIIVDKYEGGLPTYFILKSIYHFGFNKFGRFYGLDGSSDIPFQTLEQAQEYLKLLENENKI